MLHTSSLLAPVALDLGANGATATAAVAYVIAAVTLQQQQQRNRDVLCCL